ncbi:MAG: hypothetical protein M1815_000537, partial [Lichina confinis]
MSPHTDLSRATLLAQFGLRTLMDVSRHMAALARADENLLVDNLYLAIATVVTALVSISLTMALLRWIRNVLLVVLAALFAAVVRMRSHRRQYRVEPGLLLDGEQDGLSE